MKLKATDMDLYRCIDFGDKRWRLIFIAMHVIPRVI
jgi:hypothetical protein